MRPSDASVMLAAPAAAAVCAACAVWAIVIPDTHGSTSPSKGILYSPQGQDSPNASRVVLAAASDPEAQEVPGHKESQEFESSHADKDARQDADDGGAATLEDVHDEGDAADEEGGKGAHEAARLRQDAFDDDDEEEQLREKDSHEDTIDEDGASEEAADKDDLEDAGEDARKEPRVTEDVDDDGGGAGELVAAGGGAASGAEPAWPTGWLWGSGAARPGPSATLAEGQHFVPAVFGVGRDYRHLGMRAAFVPLPLPLSGGHSRSARHAGAGGGDFDDGLFRDSGFDALEEAGNQDFQEAASKGRHGHEDHKHTSEEKGGKWEDDADQGEDKGGKHKKAEGQWGYDGHLEDKHDTSAAKKGFKDKYNFDKSQKRSSFYNNGQETGSFKEYGHNDSYYFDNDTGDEAGKFKQGDSHEKHSGHSVKSNRHHAAKGGNEWAGKRGQEERHSGRERHEDADRHRHTDHHSYGHEQGHYGLTPGFYSWG